MSQSQIEKPATVSKATKLLYLTLIIGAVRSFLDWSHLTKISSTSLTVFTLLFSFAIIWWLIYKIDWGRNWARITFLVLTLFGMPFYILPLLELLVSSPISGILGLAQVALQITALMMLFSRDARPWFRP